VLLVVTAAMIAVRYLDVTRLKGFTATGEPGSPTQWRRYAGLLAAALARWVLAHLAAHWRR